MPTYRRLEAEDDLPGDPDGPPQVHQTMGEALGFIRDKDSIAARDGCYYVRGFPQWLWGIIFFLGGCGMFTWGSIMFSSVDEFLEKNMWGGALCYLAGLVLFLISFMVCRFRSDEFDTMRFDIV